MQHAYSTQPHATTKQAKSVVPVPGLCGLALLEASKPTPPEGKGSEASLSCQWTRRRGSASRAKRQQAPPVDQAKMFRRRPVIPKGLGKAAVHSNRTRLAAAGRFFILGLSSTRFSKVHTLPQPQPYTTKSRPLHGGRVSSRTANTHHP